MGALALSPTVESGETAPPIMRDRGNFLYAFRVRLTATGIGRRTQDFFQSRKAFRSSSFARGIM
jgi:hypothetical protein